MFESVRRFPEKRLDDLETVDYPWLAEPDGLALQSHLRYVVGNDSARGINETRSVYNC